MENLLLAIVLLPFIGFLVNGLLRNKLPKGVISSLACATIFISFILSILVFIDVRNGAGGVAHYFDFIRVGS